VPFGTHSTINYGVELAKYKTVLSTWEFKNCTYRDIKLKDTDFVFADPPYDVEFRNYSKDGFSWSDQECLVDWLSVHHGPIIVSNSATDRIVNLYKKNGYKLSFMKERININSTGNRTPANVVIAAKNVNFKEII
jgi:DNA adenine methylase